MGGEKKRRALSVSAFLGSPPRGRGKEAALGRGQDDGGITPAWAGKSRRGRHRWHQWRDHPRVGGEKRFSEILFFAEGGSPPRGRGKAPAPASVQPPAGITPAWAGKRQEFLALCDVAEDHPRVGGEKFHAPRDESAVLGSPPRGRGKADTVADVGHPVRITPAWAGKRSTLNGNVPNS